MSGRSYYNIVTADDSVELEKKVNSLMEAGFVPIGGPVIDSEYNKFYQAVLYAPQEHTQ